MKLKTILLFEGSFMPGSLSSGDTDLHSWEDSIKEGDGWFMHYGTNDHAKGQARCSVQVTEGNTSKHEIVINTRRLRRAKGSKSSIHERIHQAIKKIGRAWANEARKLYNSPKHVSECGNKTMRTWSECFEEAKNSPKIKPYLKLGSKDAAPTADSVNFTNVV